MASAKKAGGGEALPSLNSVLSTLATHRSKLDEYDKQLSEVVKTLEDKLRARISTRVFTVMQTGGEFPHELWQERLTFGKWDGRWQLLIESGDIDDPESWKTQPLISAAREMRVRVFTDGFMEKLIREAGQQLEAQIAERVNAMKIASNLIDALAVDDDIPF